MKGMCNYHACFNAISKLNPAITEEDIPALAVQQQNDGMAVGEEPCRKRLYGDYLGGIMLITNRRLMIHHL